MKPSKIISALALTGVGFSSTAGAATLPNWVGTADYTVVGGSAGEAVGPFDTYDFAAGDGGLALLVPDTITNPSQITVGDIYSGVYQSYVTNHQLGTSTVSNPKLNVSYELTTQSAFQTQVTNAQNLGNGLWTINFQVLSGSLDLFFDSAVNRDVTGDAGITDGTNILKGSVTGGTGVVTVSTQFPSGLGVTSSEFTFVGNTSFYDSAVYDPDTIGGGQSLFSLFVRNPTAPPAISSVGGIPVTSTSILYQADGSLTLTAVPVPAAFWLLASALAGMSVISRRSSKLAA
ncbi:flocculation-associated PEP-CTERM protein PepA [Methylocaldum sp. GT1BB]|uniref:flocculation-associated PEP-CTERM protein PepA n=1 Tax=Methylocaldum sp. GT1BB TaxID=3438963 RepID=UPI003DA14A85